MDLLKTATDWARAEVFSSSFFVFFGMVFLFASASFWYLGKTSIARAYVTPTLIAGCVLMIIGAGLIYANISRISAFSQAFHIDQSAFLQTEVIRAEKTLNEYKTIVFTAIPIIMAVCMLGIMFMNASLWRASLITTIATLTVILLVDGTAHGRMQEYHHTLLAAQAQIT
ncbi:hypothetical protein [Marinomonas epiphytica]